MTADGDCSHEIKRCLLLGRKPRQLENPMNSIKKQKDRTLKDEFPRSVGTQYVNGDQWRRNFRKTKETKTKQKQYPIVDVTDNRSKV